MDAVDAIARGEPPERPSKIIQASMETDAKAPPAASLPEAIPSILPSRLPGTH